LAAVDEDEKSRERPRAREDRRRSAAIESCESRKKESDPKNLFRPSTALSSVDQEEERRASRPSCLHMAMTMQASRCTTLRRNAPSRSAKAEVSGLPVQRAARRHRECQFVFGGAGRFRLGRGSAATVVAAAAATSASTGDTLDLDLPPRLSLSIGEPCFSVSLTYDALDGPLDGASRVVARVGVAAWQWTQDVELAVREEKERGGDPGDGDGSGGEGEKKNPKQLWSGFVSVPASRLPAPGHLDLQAAFFAPRGAFSGDSEERWDNAGGLNWGERSFFFGVFFGFLRRRRLTFPFISQKPPGVAADVAPVSANSQQQPRPPGIARAPPPAESARAAASLLLRLDALAARRESALPPGSAPLLRVLARAGDGPLLSAYERCRSWTDDAAVASELARAGAIREGPERVFRSCLFHFILFSKGGGTNLTRFSFTPTPPPPTTHTHKYTYKMCTHKMKQPASDSRILHTETTAEAEEQEGATDRSASSTSRPRRRPLPRSAASPTSSLPWRARTSRGARTSSWCCPSTTAGTTGRCRSCASSGGSRFPGEAAAAERATRRGGGGEGSRLRSGARSARGCPPTSSSPSSPSLPPPLSRRRSGAGPPTAPQTTPSASCSSPSPRSSFCSGRGGRPT